METDVQNDDLDVSSKQDGKPENGKYTLFVEIIIKVYFCAYGRTHFLIGIISASMYKTGKKNRGLRK